MDDSLVIVAEELNLDPRQVNVTAELIAEGATIPFIARYRKEATGSLDEVILTAIRDRMRQIEELNARKTAILKSLETHGHLTPELREKVATAPGLAALEDIYLPFRPKRRTKATVAREKGLEPLASEIFEQTGVDPESRAADFVAPAAGADSIAEALEGARHIMAEWVNEDVAARDRIRALFFQKSVIRSRCASGAETTASKYQNYFDWKEPVASAPSHRILAMRRGEKENVLNLSIAPPEETALGLLETLFVKGDGADSAQVRSAVQDSYKRLLSRSMETEIRLATKQKADQEAITVFARNLKQLLMAPPLGPKRVMGIDPGFRTGCKLVCLDPQGKLLHHDTIYPHGGENGRQTAEAKVINLCRSFDVEAVAVGNGTAGRETVDFLKPLSGIGDIPIVLVNESGASVYSASEVARREFPDLDLTLRGAVSIGRRLMDPLAELVKIDPKSIGVGQYQHDVDPSALKQALDDVVMSCVNAVGVDVNRASPELLTYVSGLGPQLAENIVGFRNENGPFTNRNDLKRVPRLGPKAFEQSAGFLRIHDGDNPLDASAVHPESYAIVAAMARDLNSSVAQLMQSAQLRREIDIHRYVSAAVGLPTLEDILSELDKPGRDPRNPFESMEYSREVNQLKDLKAGMKLPGMVTNITAFGAFVDIGVHQDGLVHISELADRFVKDPADVVQVHQKVTVTVLEVDLERNRIALSMRTHPDQKHRRHRGTSVEKSGRPPARRKPVKPKKTPFHNPFAQALKPKV
jgi:uncharacterized protein